ncbi:hypothetical protein ACTG9Q_13960 [Actinokineospora sp. 24-640]
MFRCWLAIVLLFIVLAPALDLEAPPAGVAPERVAQPGLLPAPPAPTVTPDYRAAVFGDFRLVGNSVLRCPVDGEVEGDHTPADCASAMTNSAGGGGLLDSSGNNNGYYMHLADVDGRADSFTSSRASVAIPAGATVRYAQLHWGGHTGTFVGFSGVNCVRPLLLQGEPPPLPAAPTPAEQRVRIAVDAGEPSLVARDPAHLRMTDGLTEPSQIYTDWADVTAAFGAEPATGEPVVVTVSNVWAPTGPGCAAGWSLVVVFGYDEPREPYLLPRVVDLYTDDLPGSGVLVPGLIEPLVPGFPSIIDDLLPGLVPGLTGSSVILPGVTRQRSGADIEIGVTAYDGDWRQGGERFMVDGEPMTEPCLGDSAEDFFRSCASGAIDPLSPERTPTNNLSVDAKTVRPTLADNDTGDIEIGVASVVDFVVLQNVVLAETVAPSVAITNTGPIEPVRQGDLATFAIEIRNDGALPLFDIELADTSEPPSDAIRCTPTVIAPIEPGETRQVTCVQPAGATGFTNTATVTAAYLTGPDGEPETVTASASAVVTVEQADYAVERVPDRLVIRAGETVTFAVKLINNTAADLTSIAYTDSVATSCTGPADTTLAAGETELFECATTAQEATFSSSGQLIGTPVSGPGVTITSPTVTVRVIEPTLTVTQAANKDTVYRGDSVTFTFTVEHTGSESDGALANVRVTAEALPGCTTEPIAELLPGESAERTCTASPARTVDVVATASAVDVAGGPVTASAEPTTITVLDPLLELTQRVDKPTVRVGGEVTITFTATHIGGGGDGTLSDIRIASPTLPPDCAPEPIAALAPGESQERACTAIPDRSFDNQAGASAIDELNREMRVAAAPLRVTVINPVLTISATAEQERVPHGADIDFGVTVRNIGDVPLTLQVTNDTAPDCDFAFTSPPLRPGAANGQQCKATAPTEESAEQITNIAAYTAQPTTATGDTGPPLAGSDDATVVLLPGQAPPDPSPGIDPVTGGGGGGSDGPSGGSESPGGAPGGGGGQAGQDLAETGSSVTISLGLGLSLLLLGALTLAATSHRRFQDDTFLSRWWPSN